MNRGHNLRSVLALTRPEVSHLGKENAAEWGYKGDKGDNSGKKVMALNRYKWNL